MGEPTIRFTFGAINISNPTFLSRPRTPPPITSAACAIGSSKSELATPGEEHIDLSLTKRLIAAAAAKT